MSDWRHCVICEGLEKAIEIIADIAKYNAGVGHESEEQDPPTTNEVVDQWVLTHQKVPRHLAGDIVACGEHEVELAASLLRIEGGIEETMFVRG